MSLVELLLFHAWTACVGCAPSRDPNSRHQALDPRPHPFPPASHPVSQPRNPAAQVPCEPVPGGVPDDGARRVPEPSHRRDLFAVAEPGEARRGRPGGGPAQPGRCMVAGDDSGAGQPRPGCRGAAGELGRGRGRRAVAAGRAARPAAAPGASAGAERRCRAAVPGCTPADPDGLPCRPRPGRGGPVRAARAVLRRRGQAAHAGLARHRAGRHCAAQARPLLFSGITLLCPGPCRVGPPAGVAAVAHTCARACVRALARACARLHACACACVHGRA